MVSFADETASALPSPFVLPDSFRLLLDWIERNGWVRDSGRRDAERRAVQKRVGWLSERNDRGSQDVRFQVDRHFAAAWLGLEEAAAAERLVAFATIGGEGTNAAFWLDDSGRQRIVALGSGSGSTLACVLADDPVDFLRLLAIGYMDLPFNDEWDRPPEHPEPDEAGDWSPINEPYRRWLTTTFGVTVPETASELVPNPAEMGDEDTDDDFANWLEDK